MNKHVNTLFQEAMNPIMEDKLFLSQEDFNKHMGKIFIITGAVRELEKQLKKNE